MREIKFRAWDGKKLNHISMLNLDVCNHDESFILEQYTGLKDSKGKEIYEGDILKGFHFVSKDGKEYIQRTVKWNNQRCMFYMSNIKFDHEQLLDGQTMMNTFFKCCNDDVEIIGNIHENSNIIDNEGK